MNSKLWLLNSYFFLISTSSFGQINFGTVDTGLWKVDTSHKTLTIQPKFEFKHDTSLYFYEYFKGDTSIIMTISISKKWVSGNFIGTQQFPNENSFNLLNYDPHKMDSSVLLGLVDTIFMNENDMHYCVEMEEGKATKSEKIYLTVTQHKKGATFPTSYTKGNMILNENEPPMGTYYLELHEKFIK